MAADLKFEWREERVKIKDTDLEEQTSPYFYINQRLKESSMEFWEWEAISPFSTH
jgi:hypothetical protein